MAAAAGEAQEHTLRPTRESHAVRAVPHGLGHSVTLLYLPQKMLGSHRCIQRRPCRQRACRLHDAEPSALEAVACAGDCANVLHAHDNSSRLCQWGSAALLCREHLTGPIPAAFWCLQQPPPHSAARVAGLAQDATSAGHALLSGACNTHEGCLHEVSIAGRHAGHCLALPLL